MIIIKCMENYIINTTTSVYLTDLNEIEIFQHVKTIKEVITELNQLRKKQIKVDLIETKNIKLMDTPLMKYLSDVDIDLVKTAKSYNAILITDDRKLAHVTRLNNVRVMDTPRLICTLAFGGIIGYGKANDILVNLAIIYNRKQAVKRAINTLNEWR